MACMLTNITTSIDSICPKKIFKIKKYKEPWISQELLELIKDKDISPKKAKKSKKKRKKGRLDISKET